ncbi:MAG: hypothetical protein OEV71_13120 [Nitrospira sp.]|nr:hypothetical protein [Nitrospira sp.]MDH4344032.1 hypothetical protein [Nitrospira sp.]MDH5338092.1 hypothetical protein [Nitrospira sp.]
MKTRISAIVCLLCVIGYAEVTRAEDPYSQRVADPYALSPGLPTMSSGTLEPYLSFMAGVAIPFSQDATFRNGDVERKVDYQMKQSIGGNAGIWFPTRNKMAGFDLGLEISGFVWYPDIACCRNGVNGTLNPDGSFEGTTTETQGIYVGANVMLRYPMGISEAYPNGRWFPYVGVGGGAHQIAQRPGGFRGAGFANAIADQRNTAPGFMAVGGFKAHLFKYVAAFLEAKYVQAFHDELGTDRFGVSQNDGSQNLFLDNYESTMRTIFVHGGLSIHFDVRP